MPGRSLGTDDIGRDEAGINLLEYSSRVLAGNDRDATRNGARSAARIRSGIRRGDMDWGGAGINVLG